MDRLFLGFHIKITLSLLGAALLALAIVMPGVQRQFLHNMESGMSVPLRLLAATLADEQTHHFDAEANLSRLQRPGDPQVAIIAQDQTGLSPRELDRLARGEIVAQQVRALRPALYVRIGDSDRVMRVGPLRPTTPLGNGRGFGLLFLVFCGLSFGVYLLVRPLRRRLAALSQAAAAFGLGDLSARTTVGPPDAIGALAATFNRMAREIERLIATQKELLRMVSHELRTPLQRIQFALEKVRGADDAEQRLAGIKRVDRDLRELDTLIEELLTYVRLQDAPPLDRQPTDLRELAEEVIATQSELAQEVSLRAALGPTDLPTDLPMGWVNARLLRRALGNLIGNGIHHARSRVEVSISRNRQQINFDVDDDGPGVPAADRRRIFEPFARLDIERLRGPSGCGLGLAIVRRIAEQHDGLVTVDDSPLGGARFRLSLPIRPKV